LDSQNLSFSFTEPRLLGRDLSFGVDTSTKSTDSQNALYDTTRALLRPRIGFPISENGRLTVYYAYDYTEVINYNPADPLKKSPFIQADVEQGGIGTNSLGYSYSYDTRRTGLNPNAGVLFRFGQEFGFGDSRFIDTTAEVTVQTRVLSEEVTLRATIEGGLLSYTSGDSRITDRYFLGSGNMRGFEPGGIGPRDFVSDDALGGNALAVVRLEAEFPLGLPEEYGISGGMFLDYGSVWDVGSSADPVLYDDFTPRTVAGVSIFWDTPIGPLRFNYTKPLDVQENDQTKQFDVTISTDF